MILFVRQTIVLFLVAVFLFQTAGKFIIYADYIVNKESITKKFCENKNKPTMHCNGKCHLKKQLEKQDSKEQSPSNPFKEIKDFQPLYGNSSIGNLFKMSNSLKITNVFAYSFHISSQHLHSIYHPPRA